MIELRFVLAVCTGAVALVASFYLVKAVLRRRSIILNSPHPEYTRHSMNLSHFVAAGVVVPLALASWFCIRGEDLLVVVELLGLPVFVALMAMEWTKRWCRNNPTSIPLQARQIESQAEELVALKNAGHITEREMMKRIRTVQREFVSPKSAARDWVKQVEAPEIPSPLAGHQPVLPEDTEP